MTLIAPTNPRLFDFVVQWEDDVAWMYLDSRGLPTVGIGHLIGHTRDAPRQSIKDDALFIHRRFGFFLAGRRATDTEVVTRLYGLLSAPEYRQRSNWASTYWRTRPEGTSPVEMNPAGIRGLKQHDLGRMIAALNRPGNWPGHEMSTLPEAVQIVLVDIAFNAGPGALRRPNMATLRTAVEARDFAAAAEVVGGGGFPISRAVRNTKRAQLLRHA